MMKLLLWILSLLPNPPKTPTPLPTPTPPPAPTPAPAEPLPVPPIIVNPPAPMTYFHPKIIVWAKEIRHQEGGKPTDLNIINNNPGNMKNTKYTASLGGRLGNRATDGGSFCYFNTADEGFNALCQFLTDACNNLLIGYHNVTISQFTTTYARPPGKAYENGVAAALGVPVTTLIKTLIL